MAHKHFKPAHAAKDTGNVAWWVETLCIILERPRRWPSDAQNRCREAMLILADEAEHCPQRNNGVSWLCLPIGKI